MKNPTTPARGYLLSAVGAAALLLCHTSASAFSLGRMTVQSALGENLRAEIEVTNLSPEEAATLQSAIASGEAFRAAGVDFNPALSGAEATLQRRADGRAVIRIAGTRAVSEPFVDLILNFTWSGGRLQRSYTLLIDPPTTKAAPAPAAPTTSPVLSSPPAPRAATPAAPVRAPAAEPAPPKPVAAAPRPASKPAAPASESSDTYSVRAGDTLSGIARRHAQSGVSLDQMLVGLYRSNPDAFAGNNMNRLKAGAKLSMPDAQTAGAISSEEARQVIQAQSSDFAAFRQRLAQSAPAVKSSEPERQTSGKVEAAVQDRKAPAAGQADELKLSRPSVKPGAEAKVSKETERKAAEARVAELSRNVQELKKLSQGTAAAMGGAPSAPAKPGVAVPAATASVAKPAPAPASAPAAVASAPVTPPLAASAATVAPSVASAVAETASLPASQPAKPKPKVKPPVVPAPVEEEGFVSSMMGNPIVPVAGISIVALLAGLGVTRLLRRRKQGGGSETSFVESRMQPDSFFGVSGGQRVDTRDGASSSSSLSYSLSQLDAIGDVDPVAEADVYLAYGRDLQAEEILKEALRADGGRVAIRSKLLEVYAKRADARSFETQARQVLEMTGGVGDEWERAKELGRQVDPANELYQQGGPITEVDIDTSSEPPPDLRGDPDEELSRPIAPAASMAAPEPEEHSPDTQPSELPPLDLDIDLAAASKLTGLESTRPISTTSGLPDLPVTEESGLHALPEVPATGMEPLPDLAELPPFEVAPEASPRAAEEALPQPEVEQVSESKSMDFDFGDLSLDLGTSTVSPSHEAEEVTTASPETLDLPALEPIQSAAAAPAAPTADDFTDSIAFDLEGDAADPLQRKVELADEFRRIGDVEGARDLLEEVVSKATEPLRSKAQAMLDELG
ncbi:FimV/HubP family polar landmark protein [Ideonella sp. B508-1]|uniref:FimV/HubP family polar landmark protein n=1 Tax=Ideonella sp. B508-1 TaxID=137716 RepID=UPI0003470CE6|nr:FimV/HubP family polar landmark protein [Ideonella sp. B508-1]